MIWQSSDDCDGGDLTVDKLELDEDNDGDEDNAVTLFLGVFLRRGVKSLPNGFLGSVAFTGHAFVIFLFCMETFTFGLFFWGLLSSGVGNTSPAVTFRSFVFSITPATLLGVAAVVSKSLAASPWHGLFDTGSCPKSCFPTLAADDSAFPSLTADVPAFPTFVVVVPELFSDSPWDTCSLSFSKPLPQPLLWSSCPSPWVVMQIPAPLPFP